MQLFILCIYFFYFTLHVSGSHKPIIRGVSSCFFYTQPFGSCGVYVAPLRVPVDWFVVMVSLYWLSRQTSPQAHTEEQHKHCMNQMVVYIKKQLETPLMMGL